MNAGHERKPRAVLFDFDGTLSTLRSGWEGVMRPLMLEMIWPDNPEDAALQRMVDTYIDESTGIQTIHQMAWLAEQVAAWGKNMQRHDAWWYKDVYNDRLLAMVADRVRRLEAGEDAPETYLMAGSEAFLQALRDADIRLYVASGTDEEDVRREAGILGLASYFERIAGAPHRRVDCSKEAVIGELLAMLGMDGRSLVVVGDGKVEIGLAKKAGARALGVASDERVRSGINPQKVRRLQDAGADWIIGDFLAAGELLAWMGIG